MSLAALAAYACGVPAELIAETLSAPDIAPPGRLEPFGLPNGARAFVDYAHTDDALFRVLTAIPGILQRTDHYRFRLRRRP